MKNKLYYAIVAWTIGSLFFLPSGAAEFYVDNLKGSDNAAGTVTAPLQTITRALFLMKGGDSLHLAANEGNPYRESLYLNESKLSGTEQMPTIIDGHGATVTGLRFYDIEQWKDEGGGVYSRTLGNNAWAMDMQGYWSSFPLVFANGTPLEACKSREELLPMRFFLKKIHHKQRAGREAEHDRLYIRLMDGQTPQTVKVECVGGANTNVGANPPVRNVIFRNLVSVYSGRDGFGTFRTSGIRFENVRGSHNMDQGISNHGSTGIVVVDSRFDHNAGGGIVDVFDLCQVQYERCVIENDTFRGGVELKEGEYVMKNCIIRNNAVSAININCRKAVLDNCLIIGDGKARGITIADKGESFITRCVFRGFTNAVFLYSKTPEALRVSMSNSLLLENKDNFLFFSVVPAALHLDGVLLSGGTNTFDRKVMDEANWDKFRETYPQLSGIKYAPALSVTAAAAVIEKEINDAQ